METHWIFGMVVPGPDGRKSHSSRAAGSTGGALGAGQGAATTTTDPFTSTTNLVTNGWTAAAASRLNAGDVITIGHVELRFEESP